MPGNYTLAPGKRRQLGDDTATKLERGMNKDKGWMDVDHSAAETYQEAAYLDRLRKMSPKQRDALARMMDEIVEANSAGRPHMPPPTEEEGPRPSH